MPMIPELAYAMLACARIGAVHSVVFGGFSAESLRDRILDARCQLVVTANEGLRGGKRIPLKETVDQAIEGLSLVETVLVARRTDTDGADAAPAATSGSTRRCRKQRSTCTVEWMGAEDPLFILYTSGSTGKPKGVLHTTGGYLVYAALTHKLVFDYHPGDIYFCAADVGWITGHSYIVYGPLANGATTVMFESTPLYPDAGPLLADRRRPRRQHLLHRARPRCAPSRRPATSWVKRYQRKSLRILGTRRRADQPRDLALVPRRGGRGALRGGRHLVADRDRRHPDHAAARASTPAKPGSATLPFFGVQAGGGRPGRRQGARGQRRERRPLPARRRGRARRARSAATTSASSETYFSQYPGLYFTGDGCRRDEDGYYWITGRIDDVLNVSGHRLGTAEVESALVAHEAVAEAAVVGFPHAIKGQGIYAYVILTADYASGDAERAGRARSRSRCATPSARSPRPT